MSEPLDLDALREAVGPEYGRSVYECKDCGISPTNRSTWCDLGCGSDYDQITEVGVGYKTAVLPSNCLLALIEECAANRARIAVLEQALCSLFGVADVEEAMRRVDALCL